MANKFYLSSKDDCYIVTLITDNDIVRTIVRKGEYSNFLIPKKSFRLSYSLFGQEINELIYLSLYVVWNQGKFVQKLYDKALTSKETGV